MNMITGGPPLGEAFSRSLRAFWNLVDPQELYSSPDGTQLAVICSDGSVRVVDAPTSSERCRFIGSRRRLGPFMVDNPVTAKCAAWSPDGLRLAVGYEDGTIRIWDLAFQDEQLGWEWHSGNVTHLAWSPDGQFVASVGDDAALGVWEAATGEEYFIYQGPDEPGNSPPFGAYPYECTFAPDSRHLAVACSDSTIRVLIVDPDEATTTEIGGEVAILRCSDLAETLAWSPVGACMLVLSSRVAAVWNPFEDHFQPLVHAGVPLRLVAWSSDGGGVALGSEESVGMWRWEDLFEGRIDQGLAYYGKGIRSISWLRENELALACAQEITLASVGTLFGESAGGQRGGLFTLKYDPNDSSAGARAHYHYMIVVAANAYGRAPSGSTLAKTCERVLAHLGRYPTSEPGELEVLHAERQKALEAARLDLSCERTALQDLEASVRLMETLWHIQRTPLEQLPLL